MPTNDSVMSANHDLNNFFSTFESLKFDYTSNEEGSVKFFALRNCVLFTNGQKSKTLVCQKDYDLAFLFIYFWL